jgi:hypothetical protein
MNYLYVAIAFIILVTVLAVGIIILIAAKSK